MGHAVMGAVRLVERNHDEALALCRQSIGFRASCPFAIGQLAAVQMYTGDPGGAAKTAREALGVRSSYLPQLVNLLAAAYRDDGRFDLSIPAAREATRIDPGHVDAMVTLCSDFGLQGSAGEAAAMASEILRVDPEFRISGFVARQPYREPAQLDRIVGALRAAALPA
jgi:tetratricopeptide (TPR) repeat protein